MATTRRILCAVFLILLLALPAAAAIDPDGTYLLFAYFVDGEVPGGGGGLHLAWSADGVEWNPLRPKGWFFKPVVSPMLRDPSIARGPDGTFHMVWTVGWTSEHDKGIGYAASTDLVHWTNEKIIPVMAAEPTARNCWAPEVFFDPPSETFFIFWSSTIPGRFPETDKTGDDGYNHRPYVTTTRDFKTFTPTRLFYDPGFNSIDAFILRDGARYLMFIKNETLTPPKKHIVIAEAAAPEGPYGKPSRPLTQPWAWAEGPAAVTFKEQTYLYFDQYSTGRYGLLVSKDLKRWKNRSADLRMPPGIRHGTAFPVDGAFLARLISESGK